MSNHTTMQTCDEDTMQKYDECGMTGHPSTDCNNGKVVSFNLFGVQIDPNLSHEDDRNHQGVTGGSIRKCKSMEILNVCNNEHTSMDRGYLSDEHPRKKGVPWTEDEHRSFLIGLEKLGKGDWRGISKNYVPSRTPNQVASHAQKYFIRMNAPQDKSKRRSLFDMPSNVSPKVPIAPTIATSARPPPPVSRINHTYNVRDYANYMLMGYHNRNEQRIGDLRFSPRLSLLSVPLMNFPDQGRAYPPNSGLPTLFMARSPFVSHVPLPTHKSWVEKDNRRME